jgi:hypothetical protein
VVTPGTTTITVSVATQATADTPSNPDVSSYEIPVANTTNQTGLVQLLLTDTQLGVFELFATPAGSLSDSADGAWVESTKTLTPSNPPGWVAGALVGLPVTVNSASVGTVVSNTALALVTSANGSVSNGTYAWSITSPNLVLCYNYATNGDFYNWVNTVEATAPYAGMITKMRFYNNSTVTNVFGVGANIK